MGRILTVVLAIAVLGGIAWKVLYGSQRTADPARPTQQLENVREAAKRIETNDQQHLDDLEKKAFGNE